MSQSKECETQYKSKGGCKECMLSPLGNKYGKGPSGPVYHEHMEEGIAVGCLLALQQQEMEIEREAEQTHPIPQKSLHLNFSGRYKDPEHRPYARIIPKK